MLEAGETDWFAPNEELGDIVPSVLRITRERRGLPLLLDLALTGSGAILRPGKGGVAGLRYGEDILLRTTLHNK